MGQTTTTPSKKLNKPPKVLSCNCQHPYQDKVYGPKMRLHNHTRKGGGTQYRCTVCCDLKFRED